MAYQADRDLQVFEKILERRETPLDAKEAPLGRP